MTLVDGLGRVGTLRSLATGALGFLAVGITASHQGAYFPPAWGSLVWSASIPRTIDEIERSIIYIAAIAALFALASSEHRLHLIAGVLASIVVISA